VKAAKECEAGVAIVETRLSFLNMLVAQLTGGLYTPMHIKVTCAEPSRIVSIEEDKDFKVAQNSSEEQLEKVFQQASDKAVDTQAPVLIKFQ
jgi:dihydroorotase-like cyclic amidohydrolase